MCIYTWMHAYLFIVPPNVNAQMFAQRTYMYICICICIYTHIHIYIDSICRCVFCMHAFIYRICTSRCSTELFSCVRMPLQRVSANTMSGNFVAIHVWRFYVRDYVRMSGHVCEKCMYRRTCRNSPPAVGKT